MRKALAAIGLVGLMSLTGFMGWEAATVSQHRGRAADTVRVTVYDTVAYLFPVPRDSVVVRYVTRMLPQSPTEECEAQDTVAVISQHTEPGTDSVKVIVPITQKKYECESYRAYVSGYEASLDSIFVHQKTLRETITLPPVKEKQPRIGFGIVGGAGYGIIHKQADLFVGGAVFIRLWP